MIKHHEEIKKVVDSKVVQTGDHYTFEIEVVTAGGITKVLRIPHSEANWLRALITDEENFMPDEERKRSFFASIRRFRFPTPVDGWQGRHASRENS